VTVRGESALLVIHLSVFSYISGSDADEASVQVFSAKGSARKGETCMASLKDAQKVVQEGKTERWGQLVQLPKNKRKEGLGFSTHKSRVANPIEGTFDSVGFINALPKTNAVLEDQSEEEIPDFVTPGGTCCNWISMDIPSAISLSK